MIFRQQIQSQSLLPMSDMDLKYNLCQQFININKSRQSILQQAYLIYQQNQILSNIKNQMQVKKAQKLLNRTSSINKDLQESNCSFYKPQRQRASFKRLPINRTSSRALNKSYNQIFQPSHTKMEFNLDSMIKEIEEHCSKQTISQVRQLIKKTNQLNNKSANQDTLADQLQKSKKQIQELKLREGELQRKLIQSQKKMKALSTTINSNSEITRKENERILLKQKYISQHQTALVLNQKRINESLKRLNAKDLFIKKQRGQLDQERRIVDEIWDKIMEKVSGTTGDSFKNDVYNKCKESLKKQRDVLKKEEEELDRQHQNLSKIIAQVESSS